MDSWGSNLSLVGGMEAMRIDIVVSEFGKSHDKKPRPTVKSTNSHFGKINKPQGKSIQWKHLTGYICTGCKLCRPKEHIFN